jgi:hypothetical protein
VTCHRVRKWGKQVYSEAGIKGGAGPGRHGAIYYDRFDLLFGKVGGGSVRFVGVGVSVADVSQPVISGQTGHEIEGADALPGIGRVRQFLIDQDHAETCFPDARTGRAGDLALNAARSSIL